jgi:hypothetical protein
MGNVTTDKMDKTNSRLNIGIIGLDTSHCKIFTQLLNDDSNPYHVPGGLVTAAFSGGSTDFPLSISRVAGYTKELQEGYGVTILPSPEAVMESCNAILIESADGRIHLEQFLADAQSGIPVFIDKPLTVCFRDALRLVEIAEQRGVPVMSSSALRFSDGVVRALDGCGNIIGGDCFGPMPMELTQPGYFWYGIHTAEMLFRIMGTGCKSISVTVEGLSHSLTGVWKDGRIGTIRGMQMGGQGFGATIHTENAVRFVDVNADKKPFYASLMDNVMAFFQTGQSAVPLIETLEIIRFVEAANESAATGRKVNL